MASIANEIERGLKTRHTGWNMGSFGAIAEFHHVADDPVQQDNPALTQVTHRGGIHFHTLARVRPIAFETLSAKPHRWNHGVALCVPREKAAMNRRKVVTEIGRDDGALRKQDRHDIIFDMGLDQYQLDFCIRTSDPELIDVMRQSEGRSLFDEHNPAMSAILATHPHRVAITRIGRIEVYQMIGGPATNNQPPVGPHTHVLPKLLSTKRTHAANLPIHDQWVPCAMFHPKNPVMNELGQDTPFDTAAFEQFQNLLAIWGPNDYQATKKAVWGALQSNETPVAHPRPQTRSARIATRNAIRQWRRKVGNSETLNAWCEHYDRGSEAIFPENPGH